MIGTTSTPAECSERALQAGYEFADRLEDCADAVVDLLVGYESYATARDEIERTLSCLRNLGREFPGLEARVSRISSFLPLNQPLYGLTLFGIVPSLMATKQVFVRPPVVAWRIVREIARKLKIAESFPRIEILEVERSRFLDGYVRVSDVVSFVGRYDNALKVLAACSRDALFLFNGAGVNPFVVGADADLELAARKIVEVKTYNSGQDCAAPDAVLVHEEVADRFLAGMIEELRGIGVGEYHDRENRVGPLVDPAATLNAIQFLQKRQSSVVFGGLVDAARNIVYPAIVTGSLPEERSYEELYAPVFFLGRFRDEEDLLAYFDDSRYLNNAMYASVFGEIPGKHRIRRTVLLENRTVLDIEQGNTAFGGFGPRANFVSSRGKVTVRPVLISREIWGHVTGGEVPSRSSA